VSELLRLHIGGRQIKPGWKILNIQPGPGVDFVGNCVDLSRFANESVDEIYASHVYEHLGFRSELPKALEEACRVLKHGGVLRISVPDFEVLCRLFVHDQVPKDQRFSLMMHAFGGQEDQFDFHRIGFTWDFMLMFLEKAGFTSAQKVKEFNLFQDFSSASRFGVPISLNVEAYK
jgi:predicted SAM-dependent methyltransferase